MGKYVLGMDIGGTNTRLGLINEAYHLSDFVIVSSEKIQNGNDTVDNLIAVIRKYLDQHAEGRTIAALGAGFPSTVDRDRKVILSTPNIKGLDNISVTERLEEEFGIPVYIDTDVDMLLLSDVYRNNLPPEGIICGFYFGTGIGNAVMINGELLVGKNGAAAELGHIPAHGVQGTCGCGNTSCIELIASGYYLRRLCSNKFPGTDIGEIFCEYGESREIIRFIDDLALAAATEINILDPDYIILGGGLTKMKDFPFGKLENSIYKYARKPYPAEKLEYIYSGQGQENGVIGAGISALKKMNGI